MRRISLKHIPIEPNRFRGWDIRIHQVFFILMLLLSVVVAVRFAQVSFLDPGARWPEGLFLLIVAASTIISLARELPLQNVILALVVILAISSGIGTVGAGMGIPFGPITYSDRLGHELFHPLPWTLPIIWLVLILNARGTARFVMRPWRHSPVYGYWLIAISTALIFLFDLGFDPVASTTFHFWSWQAVRGPINWFGTPWTNFAGWIFTSLLLLAFAVPALINKKPGPHPPPSSHPAIVWCILHCLIAIAAFFAGMGGFGIYMLCLCIPIGILTISRHFFKTSPVP